MSSNDDVLQCGVYFERGRIRSTQRGADDGDPSWACLSAGLKPGGKKRGRHRNHL